MIRLGSQSVWYRIVHTCIPIKFVTHTHTHTHTHACTRWTGITYTHTCTDYPRHCRRWEWWRDGQTRGWDSGWETQEVSIAITGHLQRVGVVRCAWGCTCTTAIGVYRVTWRSGTCSYVGSMLCKSGLESRYFVFQSTPLIYSPSLPPSCPPSLPPSFPPAFP